VAPGTEALLGVPGLPRQGFTGEIGQDLPGRALLAPRPLLHGEQDVIV